MSATPVAPGRPRDPEVHRRPLRWVESCRAKGLPVFAQCATGRAGFAFTLEHWNLYDASPAWRAVTTGTKAEKIEKMQDPELRRALVDEAEEADRRLRAIQAGVGGDPAGLIVQSVGTHEDLEHYVGRSVGDIAAEEGKHKIDVMLDLSLAGDLDVEFLGPDKGSNAEFMAEMMSSPYSIPGVSDGGAHTKFFTGGAYSTDRGGAGMHRLSLSIPSFAQTLGPELPIPLRQLTQTVGIRHEYMDTSCMIHVGLMVESGVERSRVSQEIVVLGPLQR